MNPYVYLHMEKEKKTLICWIVEESENPFFFSIYRGIEIFRGIVFRDFSMPRQFVKILHLCLFNLKIVIIICIDL